MIRRVAFPATHPIASLKEFEAYGLRPLGFLRFRAALVDLRRIARNVARHADRAGLFNLKYCARATMRSTLATRRSERRPSSDSRLPAASDGSPKPKRVGRSCSDYIAHPAFIAAAAPRVAARAATAREG